MYNSEWWLRYWHFCTSGILTSHFANTQQTTARRVPASARLICRLSYLAHARIYFMYARISSTRPSWKDFFSSRRHIKRDKVSNKQLITGWCAPKKKMKTSTNSMSNSRIMNSLNLISIAGVWCSIWAHMLDASLGGPLILLRSNSPICVSCSLPSLLA